MMVHGVKRLQIRTIPLLAIAAPAP